MNLENSDLSIGTSGTETIMIESTGQVGIGTAHPRFHFHIHEPGSGQCAMLMTNAATGTGTGDGLRLTMSSVGGQAYLTNFEDGPLNLGAGAIATLTVAPDARVGINEYEPNYELHIHRGGLETSCYMQMTNYTIGSAPTDGLLMGIDKNRFAYLTNQESGFLMLGTDNQVRLTIASDGDVGVGTVNPLDELHVHEAAPSEPCFQRWTNDATGVVFDDGFKVGIDAGGHAYIHNYENTNLRFATNDWTRMIIKSGGNVGIGDENPNAKLAVEGLVRIQNIGAWPTSDEGMELAYNPDLDRGYVQVYDREGVGTWGELYLGGGNVGIGKVNTTSKLHISGEDPYITLNTSNNDMGLRLQKNDVNKWTMVWNEVSGYLYLWGGGATRMVIEDATGDVGIGTTTPGYKLQVGNAGDGTEAAANNWALLSSREYKEDIRGLKPAEYHAILDALLNTEVVRYRLKGDERETEHVGVIAEEVPQEMRSADGKAVSLGDYSAHLLAAIKAQQERIEALEARVAELQAQVGNRW
jgi:hypothetical protein